MFKKINKIRQGAWAGTRAPVALAVLLGKTLCPPDDALGLFRASGEDPGRTSLPQGGRDARLAQRLAAVTAPDGLAVDGIAVAPCGTALANFSWLGVGRARGKYAGRRATMWVAHVGKP